METAPDLVSVQFLRFPIDIQRRAAERNDALMREFALMRTTQPDNSVPNRLNALVDNLSGRFSGFGEALKADIEAARERGDDHVDLAFSVPAAVGEAAREYNEMLDEVNEYCRAGRHLVTLQETPDILALRRWFLREITEQVGGAPPVPFTTSYTDDATLDDADADNADNADDSHDAPAADGGGDLGDEVVVAFEGELDMSSAEGLRRQVTELRERGAGTIILDASAMTFIDSVGLSVVIALHLRLAESGDALVLRHPSAAVMRMLEVAGLTNQLVFDAT